MIRVSRGRPSKHLLQVGYRHIVVPRRRFTHRQVVGDPPAMVIQRRVERTHRDRLGEQFDTALAVRRGERFGHEGFHRVRTSLIPKFAMHLGLLPIADLLRSTGQQQVSRRHVTSFELERLLQVADRSVVTT